ncbi:MAG: FecR family protein [Gammaproteobacteria bacterium]
MKTALEQAVAWYARLQATNCAPRERARFVRWLAESEDHSRAYAAVEARVRAFDTQALHDPALRAMGSAALDTGRPRNTPTALLAALQRCLVPLAGSACLIAALVFAPALRDFMADPPAPVAYSAHAGEQLRVTLNDGSVTNLDSGSAMTVQMSAKARAIELVNGRALFDVAHDPGRPFSVAAGSMRVVARGTRFQVQRDATQILVTLDEGAVDVQREADGRTFSEGLRPGEQLRLDLDAGTWTKAAVETDVATSWAQGRHIFRNTPLDAVLAEVNRYAQPTVRLEDPALAELTISGSFVIGDSALILSAFEAALPVRVVDRGNELVLFPANAVEDRQ